MTDLINNIHSLGCRARFLLIAHMVASVAMIGCHLFVSTFIFKVSGQIETVALYQIAVTVSITAAYLIFGRYCKERGGLRCYQAGLFLYFLFFLLFSVFRDQIISFYILLGLQYGFGAGLYWLPYSLFRVQHSKNELRLSYFSYEKSGKTIVRIIFPFLFGWLIWKTESYTALFMVTALLLAAIIPFSKQLEFELPVQPTSYSLSRFISLLKSKRELWYVYLSQFFCGLSFFGALEVLIVLLVFMKTGSELELGLFSSLLPIVSIFVALLLQRVKQHFYGMAAIASALLFFASAAFLVLGSSIEIIILFAFMKACCIPVVEVLLSVYSYNALDKYEECSAYMAEHVVFKELFYALGRVLSMLALFFVAGAESQMIAVRILLVFLAAVVVATAVALSRIRLETEHPASA